MKQTSLNSCRGLVAGLLFCIALGASAAQAAIDITIAGVPSSDTFTISASGSGTRAAFSVSNGTITEPADGDFLNNTQSYSFSPEGGSTLMGTTFSSGGAEVTLDALNIGFEPSTLGLFGSGAPMGSVFGTTTGPVSASGTATFIIPGSLPEATFGALFNTGTYSVDSGGVTYNYIITTVPEPSALALGVAAGVLGLVVLRRRKVA